MPRDTSSRISRSLIARQPRIVSTRGLTTLDVHTGTANAFTTKSDSRRIGACPFANALGWLLPRREHVHTGGLALDYAIRYALGAPLCTQPLFEIISYDRLEIKPNLQFDIPFYIHIGREKDFRML
ncbi:hypothetical protein EVAR_90118_1 [Eumeta japonica]|uniref:Uncharacterized protein n=1 Tax=Eumeta variegata TaxID=151549 RepID=A0A4C2A1B7_EUMVA|nr:hypothetical protein EVAR_90118_1 [Eumeta japonica]